MNATESSGLRGWLARLRGDADGSAPAESEIERLEKECESLRQQVKDLMLCGAPTVLDRSLYAVPPPLGFDPFVWLAGQFNRPQSSVLEIGAREVVNKSPFKAHLPLAEYVGFDVHAGANVQVVGDAHRLSDHFEPERFDVVAATAVYEHLAMPWVVTEEIARVLRVGGVAWISTHFSWSEHEMPWHFFQFNSGGLEALFNERLGFQTVAAGKGMPMVGRFAYDCDADHAGKPIASLYCSSYIITRKVHAVAGAVSGAGFRWRDALDQVYGRTEYPPDTSLFK